MSRLNACTNGGMSVVDGPQVVYLVSGKRKSGKDYVAEKLSETFGKELCAIIRLSSPLKYQYARLHELRFDRLLDSSSYKEHYRADMIRWGEAKRKLDPTYFCRLAIELPCEGQANNLSNCSHPKMKQVWIISDARRKTDLKFFEERFKVISVRVEASEKTRTERGWNFTQGVDDSESECGLDDVAFDVVLRNDGNNDFENNIKSLVEKGSAFLKKQ